MKALIVVPLQASGLLSFDLDHSGNVKTSLEVEADGGGCLDKVEAPMTVTELRAAADKMKRLADAVERGRRNSAVAAAGEPEGCRLADGGPALCRAALCSCAALMWGA